MARGLRRRGIDGAQPWQWAVFGIPLGIFSALRQYSRLDFFLTALAFLGVSSPSFFFGLGGLIYLWIQTESLSHRRHDVGYRGCDALDVLHHLALPAIILGFAYIAIFMRYTRSSMLEVIRQAYVTTARAKGLQSIASSCATASATRFCPSLP